MNEADYKVYQYRAVQNGEEPYIPMEKAFAEKVANVDFADESYIFYKAVNPEQGPLDGGIYPESYGRVGLSGHMRSSFARDTGADEGSVESTENAESAESAGDRGDYEGGYPWDGA